MKDGKPCAHWNNSDEKIIKIFSSGTWYKEILLMLVQDSIVVFAILISHNVQR